MSPPFLCEPFLTTCCEGGLTQKALTPSLGTSSGRGCPQAGLGVPVRLTGQASPSEVLLGLSWVLPLLPLPLPLVVLLLPFPPPSAPSSLRKSTKALAPPRMDTEARSGLSRRLSDLPARTSRGLLGQGWWTQAGSCFLPPTPAPRGHAPGVILPESSWDPNFGHQRSQQQPQVTGHQPEAARGTPAPGRGPVSPFHCHVWGSSWLGHSCLLSGPGGQEGAGPPL